MASYADQVAIVTGGGGGLGRALCLRLAELGARVHIADCDVAAANVTASAIEAIGSRASVHQVDVTEAKALDELLQSVVEEQGQIDLLFNNAGIGSWGPLELVTPDQWRTAIDVNLWGTIHGTTAAYRIMIQQGFGQIVNIASLAGLLPVPATVPYATAKHAIVGLSTSLRAEAAAHGVRVNVVCHGPVRTGFFQSLLLAPKVTAVRQPPANAMPADQAVAAILRGIERNRAVIVFPARAHLLWLAYRLWPASLNRLQARLVKNLTRSIAAGHEVGKTDAAALIQERSRLAE